jgi:transcriptional regulator with XRE-family HTH domain
MSLQHTNGASKRRRPLDKVKSIEVSATAQGDQRFLGESVRELRRASSMTLAELARKVDLSVGFLSRVERDLAQPSVKVLHDISRALGVTVSWFCGAAGEGGARDRSYVVRAGLRRKLLFESGITDELLSPTLSGALELLWSRFPPGTQSGREPYTHIGEEAGVVVKGCLELWVGDRQFVLNEGDSFSFPSTEPHRYSNPTDTETIVVWAITPPTY